MQPAISRLCASLDVECRLCLAAVIPATLATDDDHVVLGMFLAERRGLSAVDVINRWSCTR